MEDTHNDSGPLPEPAGLGEAAPTAPEPLQTEQPALSKRRLGFMKGQYTVPDDIKTMFAEEIEEMFYGHRAQHKFDDIEEAVAERLRQDLKVES